LRDIIQELDKKVFPFTEYEHIGYDILGQFYSEFIRYVYGDKKLGLVLTPPHITELLQKYNIRDYVVYCESELKKSLTMPCECTFCRKMRC
ncbi:MAG: hypothetical protein AAB611_01475, partial [Patescibacteria group bacterium]